MTLTFRLIAFITLYYPSKQLSSSSKANDGIELGRTMRHRPVVGRYAPTCRFERCHRMRSSFRATLATSSYIPSRSLYAVPLVSHWSRRENMDRQHMTMVTVTITIAYGRHNRHGYLHENKFRSLAQEKGSQEGTARTHHKQMSGT